MSKLQRVATMPKQSLAAMKVAFGARAQYATILALSILMVTQIIGVVIFSGKVWAGAVPEVSITTATPVDNGSDFTINVTGDTGEAELSGIQVIIKLDGNQVGTATTNSQGEWSYSITGVTSVGNKTVTAAIAGKAMHTAYSAIDLSGTAKTIFSLSYSGWNYQNQDPQGQRTYKPDHPAVEDDVHGKMYYLVDDLSGSDTLSRTSVAIQDSATRDYLGKISLYDQGLYMAGLLLEHSDQYVWILSSTYATGGANGTLYLSKLNTVTNKVESTIQTNGNEAHAQDCDDNLNPGVPSFALSPDDSTLYWSRCDGIERYDIQTGAYIDIIEFGTPTYLYGGPDIVLSSDGSIVYTYSSDKKIYAINTQTKSVVHVYDYDTNVCPSNWSEGPLKVYLTPDDSKLYVICGSASQSTIDSTALYVLDTDSWTPLTNTLAQQQLASGTSSQIFTQAVFSSNGDTLYFYDGVHLKSLDTATQDVTEGPALSNDNNRDIVFYQAHNQILIPTYSSQSEGYAAKGDIWDLDTNTVIPNTIDTPEDLPVSGIHVGNALGKKYVSDGFHNLEISLANERDELTVTKVEVGNNPRGVVADSNETYVYVANMGDGTVSKISIADSMVVATIQTEDSPYGVVMSADDSRIYVTHYHSDKVSVINTSTNTVVGTINVGDKPAGLDVSPDGSRVYVANSGANTVSVINTTSSTVIDTVAVGVRPLFVRVNHAGAKIYVANNGTGNDDTSISVIDVQNNNAVQLWSDDSFNNVGASNIEVSDDDSLIHMTTLAGKSPDECTQGYVSTILVSINAATGVTQQNPADVLTQTDAGCSSFGASFYEGFGRSIGDYAATDSTQVTLTHRTNTPMVTITSPSNGASFAYDNNTVTVTGTGPANKTITVYIDGAQRGTTLANGSGIWSYVANNVAVGSHTFDAKWIPDGDVAVITQLDLTVQAGLIHMVDTSARDVVKTFYLPSSTAAISAVLNNAGTKVYISGIELQQGAILMELDIASGVVTEMEGSLSQAMYGPVVISADDQVGYVAQSVTNSSEPVTFSKINLNTFSFDGGPITPDNQNLIGNKRNISVTYGATIALYANSLYAAVPVTPLEDPETASVINLINSGVSSIQISNDPQCGQCISLVYGTTDRVYFVTNNNLVVVNPQTNSVLKEISLGLVQGEDTPSALVVDANDQKAYLATYGYKILEVDIASEQVSEIDTTNIPNNLMTNLDLTGDGGQLYVYNQYGKTYIVNTATGQLETVPTELNPASSYGINTGNFVSQVAPLSATINFSVQPGSVVDPPPEDPDPQPPTENPDPPTVTDVTPEQREAFKEATKAIFTPPVVLEPQNSLFALAKRIPEPFALGFPWLLLLLALILVSIQYYQVHNESIATKRMQKSVANQERLVDEQNNFVALSTHYIHTPLTVMEGEISLMVKAGTLTQAQATKLKATLTSLNAEAEAVLAQEEQNEVE